MPQIDDFQEVAKYFHNAYIMRYNEFDDSEHTYFSFNDALAFVNEKMNGDLFVNFRDSKSGKIIHILKKEKDFEHAIIEHIDLYFRITLFFRSSYKYVAYIKKI